MKPCPLCGTPTRGISATRLDGSTLFSPDNHRAPCSARCLGGGVVHVKGSHRRDRCAEPYCAGGAPR